MAELLTRIILRNDSTANWLANDDVVLLKGEVGIEFNPEAAAEKAKTKIKIGDGVHTWAELPYFGGEDAHVYEAIVAKGGDHTAAITTALNGAEPNTHDVAIVKEAIIAEDLLSDTVTQKYQHTAYRWNGTSWTAFDGNYSAKNVIFDEDFTFTTKIGTVQTLTNGSTKVAAAGKSVKDFLAGIFAAESNPARTANASVSWTTEPKGTVEVGTEVTPTYNAKFNAGSYTYGPATGLTATSWDIDVADLTDANKTTNSGTFSKFTAVDGMSGYAKITAKATHGDGAVPVTNIGNKYDEDGNKNVRIMSGTKSATSAGYTSYRAWFYGYKAGGSTFIVAEMDSDDIRGLTASNGSFTTSMDTTNMQQMFFAAPAGIVKSVAVAHSVNGAPQTVKQTTIFVKGAGNYVVDKTPEQDANNNTNGMKYDLFYVSNDNPNSGAATYTITTTKN
jgi:hypothetical protein